MAPRLPEPYEVRMINVAVQSRPGEAARDVRTRPRPRIAALLPRGEAIRNFVYGGTLDSLSREAELIVLAAIPDPDFARLLNSRYERVVGLEAVPDRWPVRLLREILELSHGRWLWSESARDRWERQDRNAASPAAWLRRRVKTCMAYPFAHPRGLELLSRAHASGSRRLRTTDRYVELLKEWAPSLVFNGSAFHGELAAPVVHAAQGLGIPTATFVFSWDNLTSQGRITPAYDYYVVWNEKLKRELLRIYPSVRPDRVFVTGTPQFDFHFRPELHWTREEFCARVGANPARPIVLYSTGMANQMPGEPRVVEGIAAMLRKMTEFGPPQLLVRVYAKDRTGRFDDLRDRLPDVLFPPVQWKERWLTPEPDDTAMYTNTLRHAAVGINVASTVSLELCMFDKPVINIGYNPPGVDTGTVRYSRYYRYDHYRPVVESGAVAVAAAEEEMPGLLTRALSNPGEASRQRRVFLEGMMGTTLDGRSAERVTRAILEMSRTANGAA